MSVLFWQHENVLLIDPLFRRMIRKCLSYLLSIYWVWWWEKYLLSSSINNSSLSSHSHQKLVMENHPFIQLTWQKRANKKETYLKTLSIAFSFVKWIEKVKSEFWTNSMLHDDNNVITKTLPVARGRQEDQLMVANVLDSHPHVYSQLGNYHNK